MTKDYGFLLVAIIAEVRATSALAQSESFTRLVPSALTGVGYALAFWCLSFPLRVIPTGVVYAVWSGMGIVLISGVAWIWKGQALDIPRNIGIVVHPDRRRHRERLLEIRRSLKRLTFNKLMPLAQNVTSCVAKRS